MASLVRMVPVVRSAGCRNKEKNMKSIAALFAAAVVAGPALAGGPTVVEPEPVIATPAPMVAPSADWSGFYAGGQLGYGDVDSNGGGLDGNGFLGGIHGGYRWDFGQFVFGTELDYDTVDINLGGDTGSLDDVTRVKLVGGADLGNSLLYATTGLAYASASVGPQSLSDDGWFYGGGMTFALNDQWTVGGELLQHNFNNFDGSGVDIDALTATARVGFRF
jgi:outer membrane immunogenic protein